MLTADLAMNFRRGNNVFPRLIKTSDAKFLRDAANLRDIFAAAIGKTRGELENELDEYVGTGTEYRILRGFIKLLTDRCEFETASDVEPSEIRRTLFLEAKNFHPLTPEIAERATVISNTARKLTIKEDEVLANLYGDLSAQQILKNFETIEPDELLDRYNVAQTQALLYKCVEMEIFIEPQSRREYRAIFNAVKHFGLIHEISGNALKGYMIRLTGAASLFHRSQKYGIQMAVFLPVLLLYGGWHLHAEIAQKEGANLIFELAHDTHELNSHYFDEPEYENPIFERLKKDWSKTEREWHLTENKEVLDAGKIALIPDFVLTNAHGAKVYLEILGFWTPKSLQKRAAEIDAARTKNYIIAVWEELRGSRDELLNAPPNVLPFKTRLAPEVLIEAAANTAN